MSMQSGCDEKEAFVMHFMDNNGKVGAFLKMYDIWNRLSKYCLLLMYYAQNIIQMKKNHIFYIKLFNFGEFDFTTGVIG